MTIAQQIKSFHDGYLDAVAEAEQQAVDVEQDFDAETTTFIFADGSCLVWSGSNLSAYGCAR